MKFLSKYTHQIFCKTLLAQEKYSNIKELLENYAIQLNLIEDNNKHSTIPSLLFYFLFLWCISLLYTIQYQEITGTCDTHDGSLWGLSSQAGNYFVKKLPNLIKGAKKPKGISWLQMHFTAQTSCLHTSGRSDNKSHLQTKGIEKISSN